METHEEAMKYIPAEHPLHTRLRVRDELRRESEQMSVEDLDRAMFAAKHGLKSRKMEVGQMSKLCMQNPIYLEVSLSQVPDSRKGMFLDVMAYDQLALFERPESAIEDSGLDWAIAMEEKAVELTPNGHPYHERVLNNLGCALYKRFLRTKSMEDLERSIGLFEELVGLAGMESPLCEAYLTNLGGALQSRFEKTRIMEDLDPALDKCRLAVEMTSVNRPYFGENVDTFARAVIMRFGATGYAEHVDIAVEKLKEAVEITPSDDPDYTQYLSLLGTAFGIRFERMGSRWILIEQLKCSINW